MSATSPSSIGPIPSPEYRRGMNGLVRVVQELSLARDLDTVRAIVRQAAHQLTAADGATFVLREGDFCYYLDEEAIGPLWQGRKIPIRDCIAGWVMRTRLPAVVADVCADPRVPAETYRPTAVRSLAMVPIRTLSPVGVVGAYWARRHEPTEDEIRLLQALADSTSVAMENLQVYAELEQRVRERTSALEESNRELREALERIQHLEKIVRMCAWTRRVELDGRWVSFEEYLEKQFGFRVTHGISTEAAAEMRTQLARDHGSE